MKVGGLKLLVLFQTAHKGLLWSPLSLLVYLFAYSNFTIRVLSNFNFQQFWMRMNIAPTNCGLSQEKKFFSLRKNVLSEDSWFSLWILFPWGWLFHIGQEGAYSLALNFPDRGKVKCSLLSAEGAEKYRFSCRTQAISCTEWIFCSVCWAEVKVHAGGLTALSCCCTSMLLQDLKTVLRDLLSFPKKNCHLPAAGGRLLRWRRNQKDK